MYCLSCLMSQLWWSSSDNTCVTSPQTHTRHQSYWTQLLSTDLHVDVVDLVQMKVMWKGHDLEEKNSYFCNWKKQTFHQWTFQSLKTRPTTNISEFLNYGNNMWCYLRFMTHFKLNFPKTWHREVNQNEIHRHWKDTHFQ